MATTLELLRNIKEKNIPAANKTFAEIMNAKRAAIESREYKVVVGNIFNKKNS